MEPHYNLIRSSYFTKRYWPIVSFAAQEHKTG